MPSHWHARDLLLRAGFSPDLTALAAVTISAAEWDARVAPSDVEQVYLYVVGTPPRLRTPMFSREHGVCEDSATGSVAAALTGYLASLQSDALQCTIHQGVEMGRPSLIYTAANGDIKHGYVHVGGHSVVVCKGGALLGK